MSKKPFTTYDEQINNSQSKKGLIINDKDFARSVLKKTSYYSLITAYKHIFKNKNTDLYKTGVLFEDIVCLYEFDQKLRILLLEYILIIERQLKSLLSYYFCEKFGENQSQYLDTNNYRKDNSSKNAASVAKLISILFETLNSHEYKYINHNRAAHNNVPLWVLINALSFGKISKMYSLSLDSVKQKICNEYANISISEMSSMLSLLTKFRNVCAHNERLYNYKTKDALPILKIQKALNLPMNKNKTSFRKGNNDMFAVLIILKTLLSPEDFENFYNKLLELITDFKFESNIVNKNSVVSEMGFPNNWKEISNI